MARPIAWTALTVGLLVLGYSRMPTIYVLNDSGVELRLHTDRNLDNDQWDEKIISIPHGRAREFKCAKVVQGEAARMEVGGCEVAYRVPRTEWRRRGSGNSLGLRVAVDLSIHQILPSGRAAGEPPAAVRHEGFPLTPISRICP